MTDECTVHKLRVSYARILVEIDITRKLLHEITIKDNDGRKLQKAIEYEWRPKFCDKCQRVGHKCGDAIKKKVWQPKTPTLNKPSTSEVVTPCRVEVVHQAIGDTSKPDNVEEGEQWTTENKAVRDRGKSILRSESQVIPGLNKGGKLREICSRLQELKPEIMILLETRVKINKVAAIRGKSHLKDKFIDNYQKHLNGIMWIGWDHAKVDIRLNSITSQSIHCEVYDNNGTFHFWLTAIYARNQLEQRKNLWHHIEDLSKIVQGAWCVVGDFNNVNKVQDRIGGRMVKESKYEDLHKMLNSTGLAKMDSTGDYFTWINKQSMDLIYSRIDRVVANLDAAENKIYWIKKGDDNNAFFHAFLKAKHHDKSMTMIKKNDDTILTNQKDIETEVMEFYRKLMGQTSHNLTNIDVVAMRREKQLNIK
ncbi:uncharacterized protein LOC131651321 [Vicia villosa]|uniref:uncharacterized protein LOC131651321 n=1 Tax=Vicia villosa TaxID=3911 RepID=UPI00273C7703|nr:uncharacterized protein LOC131651321 [Vicia villosa]